MRSGLAMHMSTGAEKYELTTYIVRGPEKSELATYRVRGHRDI